MLLYKYYTLKNVKDIIKHFNRGSDQEFNDYDLFPQKVPFMLVDDIDLVQYQREEVPKPTEEEAIVLEILALDYTDLIDPLNSYSRTFECSVDPSMLIRDFKRLVLHLLENRPFFLEFNCKNSQELQELIALGAAAGDADQKQRAAVKVFLNLDEFSLRLEQLDHAIPDIEVK